MRHRYADVSKSVEEEGTLDTRSALFFCHRLFSLAVENPPPQGEGSRVIVVTLSIFGPNAI